MVYSVTFNVQIDTIYGRGQFKMILYLDVTELVTLVSQVNIGCKDDLQERGPLINVMSVHHLFLFIKM